VCQRRHPGRRVYADPTRAGLWGGNPGGRLRVGCWGAAAHLRSPNVLTAAAADPSGKFVARRPAASGWRHRWSAGETPRASSIASPSSTTSPWQSPACCPSCPSEAGDCRLHATRVVRTREVIQRGAVQIRAAGRSGVNKREQAGRRETGDGPSRARYGAILPATTRSSSTSAVLYVSRVSTYSRRVVYMSVSMFTKSESMACLRS